uniref:FP protein C-terminal domain-containing protein n=1 Tax=Cacopsylla melanoneura TaxID=428564 RepID=A0A8D8M163_9HEMI
MPGDGTTPERNEGSETGAAGVGTRAKTAALTMEQLAQMMVDMEGRLTKVLSKANSATNEKINKLNSAVKDLEKTHKDKFSSMEKSHGERFASLDMKVLANDASLDNINKEFLEMKSQIVELQREVNELKSAQPVMSDGSLSELNTVKEELEDLRQYTRNRNLVIDGIPVRTGENLSALFLRMGQSLGMNIDPNEIEAIHRLPTRNINTNRAPTIVVQVKSRPLRDNFVSAAKKKRFTLENIGQFESCSGNVFVSEHLTPFRSRLFYEARMMRKNHGFKYAWVKSGKIYLKKDDDPGSRSVEIKCMAKLDHLKSGNH